MKFKDLSNEELQKDFKKLLSRYTPDELVKSLEPYKIETDEKHLCRRKYLIYIILINYISIYSHNYI